MSIKSLAVFLVKNGLLFVALLVVAGLTAVFTMRAVLSAQEVVVPSLVGKGVAEAGGLVSSMALLLRVEGKRNDARIPEGRIALQEPSGGATLKRHRSIRIWLSLGPRRLRIPPVEGQSVRSARLALEQAGVPVARIVEVDDPAEEGTVLVQHPPGGETEGLEEGVSLLVSRGVSGADYLMPDLIGRSAEDVLDSLRRAGLKVGDVRYRAYPGVAPGIVLRQLPPAGHRVSPRSSVSLDVSRATP